MPVVGALHTSSMTTKGPAVTAAAALVMSLVQCVSASQLSDASKCELLTVHDDDSVGSCVGKVRDVQKEFLQEGSAVAASIVTGILKVSLRLYCIRVKLEIIV